MAKKKKGKSSSGFPKIPLPSIPHVDFALPRAAQRSIWGIALFALAAIFLFSLFDNAGDAGNILKQGGYAILGKAAPLFALILIAGGIVFLRMNTESKKPVFLALILLMGGLTGVLSALAGEQGSSTMKEVGGWMGFLLAWPLFAAFGFWVPLVIFAACIAVSFVVFWQIIPHGSKEESTDIGHLAQEKIKKIFEPKFHVTSVESEPRVHTVVSGEQDSDKRQKEKEAAKPAKVRGPEPLLAVPENYSLPPTDLLDFEKGAPSAGDIKVYAEIVKKTLANFGIAVEMAEVNIGPAVTQYAFKPAEGVKLSRITALQNDLSLALAAHPIRIEAPIPGKALVGVEIPNKTRAVVKLRNLLETIECKDSPAPLLLALGKDVSGTPIFADLAKMPHLLVAGATGSGKTIGLNTIILSLIYRNSPETLRLVLVDPKRVEFPVYNDLPHLLTPVILDTQRTINALKWLIKEMERRFIVLSNVRVRDIKGYHALFSEQKKKGETDWEPLPYIVAVLDELADLMAARGKEMEGMIVRLAQMARAVGIHLILATQRPSVEVITGLIKANITSRIAFQVASQIDSRTILDASGAQQLLGQGDMLFVSSEFNKPRRIQGSYISEKEIKRVVDWIHEETKDFVREEIAEDELTQSAMRAAESMGDGSEGDEDPLYDEAKRVVAEAGRASSSLLQRRLKVGYARAARLIDILEDKGVIGPGEGAKPREVYGAVPKSTPEENSSTDWKTPQIGQQ